MTECFQADIPGKRHTAAAFSLHPAFGFCRIVVLVDDGLATGASMKAAVEAVRQQAPGRVIVAVPVGSPETCREFADLADEIVCARAPQYFAAVGQWYRDFSQTTDEEVRQVLHEHAEPMTRS